MVAVSPRRTAPRRARAVLLAAALPAVLVLASCSVAQPSAWTFDGSPLLDGRGDLAAITEAWRSGPDRAGSRAALPENAACYYSVTAPHAVQARVVCGPVRYRTGGTRWETARIASFYARDGKAALGLVDPPENAFTPVDDVPGDLRAADGTEPDTGVEIAAPSDPPLAPGEIVALDPPASADELTALDARMMADDPSRDDGSRLLLAGARAYLMHVEDADPARDPAVRNSAPPGHHLVSVSVRAVPPPYPAALPRVDDARLTALLRVGDAAPQPIAMPADPELSADATGNVVVSSTDPGAQQRGLCPVEAGESAVVRDGLVRCLIAVPDGQELSLEITDGTSTARGGTGSMTVDSTFPVLGLSDLLAFPDSAPVDGRVLDHVPIVELQAGLLPRAADPGTADLGIALSVTVESDDMDAPTVVVHDGDAVAEYRTAEAHLSGIELTMPDGTRQTVGDTEPVGLGTPSMMRLAVPTPESGDGALAASAVLHLHLADPTDPSAPPALDLDQPVTFSPNMSGGFAALLGRSTLAW